MRTFSDHDSGHCDHFLGWWYENSSSSITYFESYLLKPIFDLQRWFISFWKWERTYIFSSLEPDGHRNRNRVRERPQITLFLNNFWANFTLKQVVTWTSGKLWNCSKWIKIHLYIKLISWRLYLTYRDGTGYFGNGRGRIFYLARNRKYAGTGTKFQKS